MHLFEAVHIGFWFSHSLRVTCVNFFSFLKDVHLTKRYKTIPTVIVAAHHLSSDRNLKPIHNGITTWVEVNRWRLFSVVLSVNPQSVNECSLINVWLLILSLHFSCYFPRFSIFIAIILILEAIELIVFFQYYFKKSFRNKPKFNFEPWRCLRVISHGDFQSLKLLLQLKHMTTFRSNFLLFCFRCVCLFVSKYINKTGFRVCLKELYEKKYDPLSVLYAVLSGKVSSYCAFQFHANSTQTTVFRCWKWIVGVSCGW